MLKIEDNIMNNINKLRKLAGLPLIENENAEKKHIKDERVLFEEACKVMENVKAMCEERLAGKLSEEHKKQYKEVLTCVNQCCDVMKKHLESYEK